MPSGPLCRFGPQLPGETGLAKRLRFHQSWYRSDVLGIADFGVTPKPTSRHLGSILPAAAAALGKNFTSDAAERLYLARRSQGWGVDPVRCTQYMTSSQALTLNFLGPLFASPTWLLDTISSVLARSDLEQVEFAAVEHAPVRRSNFLGDMTRMDAFITVRTASGHEAIVMEFKYADRFNSRNVQIVDQPAYRRLATDSAVWKDFDVVARDRNYNQLTRCHALGTSILHHDTGALRTTLMAVHHEKDVRAGQLIAGYASNLTEAATAVGLTLTELCNHMATTANREQRELVSMLRNRYATETGSEPWWNETVCS